MNFVEVKDLVLETQLDQPVVTRAYILYSFFCDTSLSTVAE